MLRSLLLCSIALFAIDAAVAADGPVATRQAAYRAARQLPPGLPRPHYKYRISVTPAPYVRRGRQIVVVEQVPEVLLADVIPYVPIVNGEPILPGSSSLPGYYGNHFSYSYDGPYYGGPYYGGPYWNRLPYACGVYGYC